MTKGPTLAVGAGVLVLAFGLACGGGVGESPSAIGQADSSLSMDNCEFDGTYLSLFVYEQGVCFNGRKGRHCFPFRKAEWNGVFGTFSPAEQDTCLLKTSLSQQSSDPQVYCAKGRVPALDPKDRVRCRPTHCPEECGRTPPGEWDSGSSG